jgi:hypothetical protein
MHITTSRRSPTASQESTTVLLAHELARAGKTERLFVLIGNAGAGLVVRTGADGQSLLSSAAERGQVAVVKGLLRRYRQWIDLDAQDDRGWTALHHAVAISPSAAQQVDRTKKKAKETKKTKKKTKKAKAKAAGGKSRDQVEPSMATRQVTARNALRTYFEIHGQKVDEEDDRIGVEALEGVKLRLAHILLEAGASPNVSSRSEGVTPFHVAATEALALRLLEAEDLDRSARSKYVNAFAKAPNYLSAEPRQLTLVVHHAREGEESLCCMWRAGEASRGRCANSSRDLFPMCACVHTTMRSADRHETWLPPVTSPHASSVRPLLRSFAALRFRSFSHSLGGLAR